VDVLFGGLLSFQPVNLLKYHGLRFVTSSLEKKAKSSNAEKEKAADNSDKPEEQLPDRATSLESSTIAESNEKQSENSYGISPSTAYHIAASAASFLQSQTKSILPFGTPKADIEKNPSEAGRVSEDDGGISCSEMASFVATTNSVTAVVAGKEEMKQAVAKDLNSANSSPCEWFICDDDKSGTRYFVIQVRFLFLICDFYSCRTMSWILMLNMIMCRVLSHWPLGKQIFYLSPFSLRY